MTPKPGTPASAPVYTRGVIRPIRVARDLGGPQPDSSLVAVCFGDVEHCEVRFARGSFLTSPCFGSLGSFDPDLRAASCSEDPQVIVIHRVRYYRLPWEYLHGFALCSNGLILGVLKGSPVADGLLVPTMHDEPELEGRMPRHAMLLDNERVIGVHAVNCEGQLILRGEGERQIELEIHGDDCSLSR